ncbi:MAG: dTMP kinase [Candidatus Nitrosomirales archaeon]|jgi:dTMP kinase
MLIVIEGSDKAGKSTQTQMLSDGLRKDGLMIATMSFPDYSTNVGKEIKAFLHGEKEYPIEVRHMLLSANRWEKKAEIEKMLKENDAVILNRYYQSNLVYGVASGLRLEWLQSLDAGLPKEDVVVVLDVNPEVSINRMQSKGDVFEMDDDMMGKASKLYREFASKYGWILINGDRNKEDVHKEIMQIVATKIKQKH